MNCENMDNRYVCANSDVPNYPTLKMFNHNKKGIAPLPYTDYKGDIEVHEYALANMKLPFKEISTPTEISAEQFTLIYSEDEIPFTLYPVARSKKSVYAIKNAKKEQFTGKLEGLFSEG